MLESTLVVKNCLELRVIDSEALILCAELKLGCDREFNVIWFDSAQAMTLKRCDSQQSADIFQCDWGAE